LGRAALAFVVALQRIAFPAEREPPEAIAVSRVADLVRVTDRQDTPAGFVHGLDARYRAWNPPWYERGVAIAMFAMQLLGEAHRRCS
jgi:hypothetical protein